MINYLDRAVLGVAAPSMTKELGLDAVVMGIVFSAFSWTYAAAQIPGGAFLDRVGARLAYFWSVVGLVPIHPPAGHLPTGLASLLTFRLGLGVAEAPCFPANSRVLSTWFPQHERARATGVYSIGQYFGLAFLSPLLFYIVETMGWRALFIIAGVARHSVRDRSGCGFTVIRTKARASTRRSSTTSRQAAALVIRGAATPVRLAQHRQACSGTARSSAHPSGNSPATRRWSSFSPGSPHISRPSARWSGSRSASTPSCLSSQRLSASCAAAGSPTC